jgi:hypothetical protein
MFFRPNATHPSTPVTSLDAVFEVPDAEEDQDEEHPVFTPTSPLVKGDKPSTSPLAKGDEPKLEDVVMAKVEEETKVVSPRKSKSKEDLKSKSKEGSGLGSDPEENKPLIGTEEEEGKREEGSSGSEGEKFQGHQRSSKSGRHRLERQDDLKPGSGDDPGVNV